MTNKRLPGNLGSSPKACSHAAGTDLCSSGALLSREASLARTAPVALGDKEDSEGKDAEDQPRLCAPQLILAQGDAQGDSAFPGSQEKDTRTPGHDSTHRVASS